MSFLGPSSSSHHRSRSPARSVISTKSGGAFVRPHAGGRSKSDTDGYFVRRSSDRSRSRSRSRERSTLGSFFGMGDDRRRSSHHRSKSPGVLGSFLGVSSTHQSHSRSRSRGAGAGMLGGLFGGANYDRARSPESSYGGLRGMFSGNKHYSGTSRYNRRSRDGFLQRIMGMIRKLWRDLRRYAKNNPVKMVTLVIMPLLTSGILVKMLGGLGIKLPDSIAKFAGGKSEEPQRMAGGYYGSQGYGGPAPPPPPQQGSGIGLKEVMSVAKMFM